MLLGTGNRWLSCPSCKAVAGEGGPAAWADGSAQNNALRAAPSQLSTGLIDTLSGALASARATLSNVLDLISLEARRAVLALIWMAALALVAAICMVAAWVGLMAALVMGAVSLGLTPLAAVIAVAALNLAAGAVLIKASIGMSRNLLFSATRRQVAGKSPVPSNTP